MRLVVPLLAVTTIMSVDRKVDACRVLAIAFMAMRATRR
jgi:hypothetical protein